MARSTDGLRRRAATAMSVVMCVAGMLAANAVAETAAPGWKVNAGVFPSHLKPGTEGYIVLAIYNVGAAPSTGSITVTDRLPSGVTASEAGFNSWPWVEMAGRETPPVGKQWDCELGAVVSCTSDNEGLPQVPPGEMELLAMQVHVPASASGSGLNEITVTGGGASEPTDANTSINFSSTPAPGGVERLDSWVSSPSGEIDTQAGSHPYALTASFFLNNELKENVPGGFSGDDPTEQMRNVTFELPPGMIGNATAIPRCTQSQMLDDACPAASQVGVSTAAAQGPVPLLPYFTEGSRPPIEVFGPNFLIRPELPVYNMVPPPGVPAQFAYLFEGKGVYLNAHVRSGSDYGISEEIPDILEEQWTLSSTTIWGVPGDPSHDYQRCGLVQESGGVITHCQLPASTSRTPLLTVPTACAGPQASQLNVAPWPLAGVQGASFSGSVVSQDQSEHPRGFTGCGRLSFDPSIVTAPDTQSTDTPSGLTVEVKVPQEGLLSAEGLSTADIRDTTVTLPEGMAVNPGQAAGLEACDASHDAVGTELAPSCPNASQVGVDEIQTPLLFKPLSGKVYVLQSNPPDLQLLVAASGEGVNLKLVGDVHLDPTSGRLVTTFEDTPELPFTLFKLAFSGGAQAALTTPARCGTYTTMADFTPWSTPTTGDALPTSEFALSGGPGGNSCPTGTLPFEPELTAGSTTDQAGGFTGFSMLLRRGDGQQRIERLQFKAPPGLSGVLTGVPLCGEPQAAQGDCSAASQIGHLAVASGAGPYPLVIPQPGEPESPIYLTGPYDGAPFGLSVVTHVLAGPFDLGTIVTRAKLEIDPHTAQITVTTDPLPQIVDGVPTDLRLVNAVIDRKGFMFNPTDCEAMGFTGTAWGAVPPGAGGAGASAAISSRFQVGSCRELTFKPSFVVSTSGKTSRENGASLHVALSYPNAAFGTQANIKTVHVELPRALPSRLSTLNRACTDVVFDRNPAECPPESRVGSARATTPVLPVPLVGPAYFVSHGNQKFPELIVVLQGYGVTIYLQGETFISKEGVTSSTFKQVPDVPVGTFELDLPEGKFSALAANTNLCNENLTMPTVFTAQNGAMVSQSTHLEVGGCPSALVVVSRRVSGRTLLLKVAVPRGGRLAASGNGVSSATKAAGGRQTLTLKLRARRPGKLRTKIILRFTPSVGKQRRILHRSINVTFR